MIVVDDNMPLALRDLAQHVAEKTKDGGNALFGLSVRPFAGSLQSSMG